MNEEDYLKSRLQDQLAYFETKSAYNQRWYKRLKVLVILMSVSIPFLSGLIEKFGFPITITVGLLGVGIAIIEGIQQVYSFQENWSNYRKTAEQLKREEYLFKTKSGPYKSNGDVQTLAERIESILENENSSWLEYVNSSGQVVASN